MSCGVCGSNGCTASFHSLEEQELADLSPRELIARVKSARSDGIAAALAYLRSEAERFRERDEGADAAVASHFEIAADRIERSES